MKIQELAIIFIIIIVPISIVLSAYTQFQIQTLNTQALYDTQLTTATFDAIKAFQINTANSTMAELSNSKLRDIEASVTTFKKSIMSAFGLNGYTEDDLNNYIPALVYTMYDGFYIYSPYENTNHLYEYEYDADGNIVMDSGKPKYKKDASGNDVPLDNNGETMYGLKPYIPYSCTYKNGNINVVITYSLDNYITVQGTIGSTYVNKEGYLIDGITNADYDLDANGKVTNVRSVTYNGVQITPETLREYVNGTSYFYAKINGTKYYYDNKNTPDESDDEIFYISNGKRVTQMVQNRQETRDSFINYRNKIASNDSAMYYYAEADVFTKWVRSNLSSLTYADAYDITLVKNGNTWGQQETQLFPGINKRIFDNSQNIENELSNFNRHRVDVIKHKIESNLSIAISNYNAYSLATGIEFQLPNLNDDEWDLAINNISLISFIQGLDIGGKIYNGYTVVNSSETKEVVKEENIYILGNDDYYHRIGDIYLETSSNVGNTTDGIEAKSAGRLNLDFERQKIIVNTGGSEETRYYYPLEKYLGSYDSIVAQNNVRTFEDIYQYIQDTGNASLSQAFYTALGRERYGAYKALRTDRLY